MGKANNPHETRADMIVDGFNLDKLRRENKRNRPIVEAANARRHVMDPKRMASVKLQLDFIKELDRLEKKGISKQSS